MGRPKATIPGIVTFEKTEKIEIDELTYDLENIRSLHKNPSNQLEAEEFLKEMSDIELLKDDIQRRGLQEELIVDSSNKVIEGNRRLFASRHRKRCAD